MLCTKYSIDHSYNTTIIIIYILIRIEKLKIIKIKIKTRYLLYKLSDFFFLRISIIQQKKVFSFRNSIL